ncbi:UDP-glucose 4-epimerase family protein [Rhodoferax antarcticus]|uniref:Putative NAD-dependent epimerase/dehydratase n=1 Tax=Rhodoferax antarcticus ANT.BR TaxID=1111071 RepID=A0A1Q8YK20_9BURK|nr:SDR family oxidoreductase [Rhodoferax antarcticus]APW47766.1 NAD-dependent dehydratase [Rhodoferax antarcticus]OLP08315.1 putative NAD-dependent epimerase/dehydratase [Rhodoferax antarcticus ANT.BR]
MILVTGATGFVGKAIVQRLLADDESRRVAVAARRVGQQWPERVLPRVTGELTPSADWTVALEGVSVVIHCAARVHVMTDTAADPLEEFRRVNVQGTLNLARQAAAAGVRRFVFVSSVKVNGEATQLGSLFKADDAPAPLDAYGVSKMEAEQGLRELAAQTGMEVVIIRPPLVYGPGVKANFAAMMRWLQRGVPLPLGSIHNQRSLVALDNLVDLIVLCLTHPAAANQTFLVSDGEDVSTSELLRRMGQALDRPARLLPVPQSWLRYAAAMVGKPDVAQRLCGSLQVDITKTRQLLGWTPPLSLDEGLKRAAAGSLELTNGDTRC